MLETEISIQSGVGMNIIRHSLIDIGMVLSFWIALLIMSTIIFFDLDIDNFALLIAIACVGIFAFGPCIYLHFKTHNMTRSMGYLLLPLYFLARPQARKKVEFRFQKNNTTEIDTIELLGHSYYVILAAALLLLIFIAWLKNGPFDENPFMSDKIINAIGTGMLSAFTLWRIRKVG